MNIDAPNEAVPEREAPEQLGDQMEFRLTIAQPDDEDEPPTVAAVEADRFPEEILLDLTCAKGMDPQWIRATVIVEMNLTNGHAIYTWTNDDGDYRDLENPGFLMKRLFFKGAEDEEGTDATD